MLNSSIKSASSNSTRSQALQETQRHTKQPTAGSSGPSAKLAHPELQGMLAAKRTAQTPRQARADSPSAQSARLTQAFNAQRHSIAEQAGPSNDRHLTALDKLQARGFMPAVGGIEIPLTPHSLPGGGKRVRAIGASSSTQVSVVPGRDVAQQLRQSIEDARLLIQTATEDLANAEEEGNPIEIATNQRILAEARSDLQTYNQLYAAYREENRRRNG
ncbi:XopO/AvrRps4 family type III secretion system effector [Paracidovorax cattleyae]|uniref:Type III effector protein AvrRps4 n=1 Tax=Paracidovorax cattleyae TaxID=80868 RepID=A0A1H0PWQ8_9BURK|nr:XopO/AvrRps4 family type III secretion system effector [Paracidovorax cattleyae]SDP09474.1 type III effector protein AvrRps4 [Paracidovorax cattleyae]